MAARHRNSWDRDDWTQARGTTRRSLLIGGGVGAGLLVAFALWPRREASNLLAGPGEHVLGPFLKIGEDGHVTLVAAQAETGQGAFTLMAQLVAEELGADWRTIAVEPAPFNPAYATPRALETLLEGTLAIPPAMARGFARRAGLAVTDGVDARAALADPLRAAAATARALLCQAAARRWDIDPGACDTDAGFVTWGDERLRFGALAAEAAREKSPADPPIRAARPGGLVGQSLPRLDLPAKIDGSANFAADIRLPGMVHAAIRSGPPGNSRLVSADRTAADRVPGTIQVVTTDRYAAVVAGNWWAANRALDAMRLRFETDGGVLDDAALGSRLAAALEEDGDRVFAQGDVGAAFAGQRVFTADYRADQALHAAIETPAVTAQWGRDRLQLWAATQAPWALRETVASALGVASGAVTVHPLLVGGPTGQAFDPRAAIQAAELARAVDRPVQLVWSRVEAQQQGMARAPLLARLSARVDAGGSITGWLTRLASPASGAALAELLALGREGGAWGGMARGDRHAVAGAVPPYAIPAFAVDHHPVDLGLPAGQTRAGLHGANIFAAESFVDELARATGREPLSFRIGMLGGNARLARCLSQVAMVGGWDGGGAGSNMGLAVASMRGSHIAVLAEARVDDRQRVRVTRLAASVDVGRQPHADIARQMIEGGLLHGLADALGAATTHAGGRAASRRLADMRIPTLAEMPDLVIDYIPSSAPPGAVEEIGVPAVAPAIANALRAATGARMRRLPLIPGRG